MLRPGFMLISKDVFGVPMNGRMLSYYLVFVVCAALFLVLLRIVNSPFGRVLQAIRENPFRAEALGYRIVFHRTSPPASRRRRGARRRAQRALAALHRARHGAVASRSRSTCW